MKDYITPEVEITEFETEDVITTSGDPADYHEGAGNGAGM